MRDIPQVLGLINSHAANDIMLPHTEFEMSGIFRLLMTTRRSSVVEHCIFIRQKLGFNEVERGELPLKAWKDCLRCPKFQNCDEIAVLKGLKNVATLSFSPRRLFSEGSQLVRLHYLAKAPKFHLISQLPIKKNKARKKCANEKFFPGN